MEERIWRGDYDNMTPSEAGVWLSRGATVVDDKAQANIALALSAARPKATGNTMHRERFDGLPADQRAVFIRAGGTLYD
jgi:hypothetical protein